MSQLLLTTQLLAQGGDAEAAVAGGAALLCVGVMFVVGLAFFALWIWMLIDCIQNEPNHPDNQFVLWLLVILLAGGLGAIIYYFVRKRGRR